MMLSVRKALYNEKHVCYVLGFLHSNATQLHDIKSINLPDSSIASNSIATESHHSAQNKRRKPSVELLLTLFKADLALQVLQAYSGSYLQVLANCR